MENGTIINQYKILSPIGAGGMGEVFLAADTSLERQVALKILPEEFAGDAERMRRFVQEAKSASALNHPNIITIYEIGESGGTNYIATEFIGGETLTKKLASEPIKLITALEISIQIASALEAAHSAGIVHRDIKPDNVMIRPDGLIKILDFGIAKLTETKPDAVDMEAATAIKGGTSPGMIIGTANYMSPEQAKGEAIDARTDIFSFGAVLYEMLSGHLPFEGQTPMEIIGAVIHKEPLPLDKNIPLEIERIIGKSLRKDRNERYQTIKDLLIDLKDVKQELEFQDKLEKTVSPNKEEQKTQILKATTFDEEQQTATNENRNDSLTIKKSGIRKAIIGIFAVLLVSAIGLGYWFYSISNAKQIESIAVMPFINESGSADVEYLSDGMTETLINSLSQIPNLSVKARSSVFRYKGKELDPKKIAAELNVQAILTGRIIQRGEQMTLNLELIDARTENTIWGNKYERKSSDLVSLQSEIARDVSGKLKSRLSDADEQKITKNYTENPEAYQLYLKGKYYWNKRTGDALKQAAEFYRQAIEIDPNYALAYSGLAETYVLFSSYGVAPATDSMPQAKAAALRALEIDEQLAEAHTALGFYFSTYEFDRDKSEKEYRRAIELKPNYATAHHWFASHLTVLKRFDEAVAELKRAEELDPLSRIIGTNFGDTFVYARRYDEAIAQYKRTLVRDPNFYYARQSLGWAYGLKGMYAEAIAETRASLELTNTSTTKGYLALWLAKSGKRNEALKILAELKQEASAGYVQPTTLANVYIGLGDREEALNQLEKEASDRSEIASFFSVVPELDELRSEPRFKAMLKQMNLPE